MEKKLVPPDSGQTVAVIIFMLGLGVLLPWNFFITASQYFNQRLSFTNSSSNSTAESTNDYNYDSWMVLLSQLPLLLFTLLNSLLYHCVRERLRVTFSLVGILLLFSLTAALVQVPMHPDTFFSVTLATIWFISTCGAVLQASLFGLVGLFPPRYSTLFMSGQGLAGIFAAVAMLLSIISNADKSTAAMAYFITPCVATVGMLVCYLLLPHLVRTGMRTTISKKHPNFSRTHQRSGRIFILWNRCESSCLVLSSPDKVFTCVCCFIVFNTMDLVGRSSVSIVQWPSRDSTLLPVAVLSRLIFIPLLMLCNVENSRLPTIFTHDGAFVAIMAAFAFSNGYLATLCMVYAPQLVRGKDCETAGSLMTFFLILGLAVGAAFSFLLGSLV
uniref:Solute carrier family 29 member 2 n=1 Tax=Takifugu rubripes TaxID=31033 RepID=A0A6D2VV20_TAKRU